MAETTLRDYTIFGEFDMERVEATHSLVLELHDSFLKNPSVQDFLLYSCFGLERDTPFESYHNIQDAVFNRKKVSLNLQTLEVALDKVTRPQIIAPVQREVIVPQGIVWPQEIPYEDPSFVTAEGHDALRVEQLQVEWIRNTPIRTLVRNYEDKLGRAFREYNLKFILGRMFESRYSPVDHGSESEILRRRLVDAFGIKEKIGSHPYTALDSAYYTRGNGFFFAAQNLRERLCGDEFGAFFVLTPQEELEGLRMTMGR